MHPWVAERKGRNRFGVQVFALPDDPDPTAAVLGAGRLAESLGIDGFFVGDHPGYATDAWLHLAALAVVTERITLGSVVNCVFYRHPAVLARHTTDMTRIAHDRFLLGLGIGWNAVEFAQFGIRFPSVPERQAALEEAIGILRAVTGPAPASIDGKFWSTVDGFVPGASRDQAPPLLIAGAGDRTLGQVARLADVCNFGSGRNVGRVHDAAGVRTRLAFLRERCEKAERPYDDILRSHFTTWLMLAPNEREAKAKLDRYYPHGMNEDQQRTRIWGTPSSAIEYFDQLRDAGMEYFVVQILDARDTETMELLARKVAPRVKIGEG